MATEKTLAIVLRVIDFSETSCVVTLFTRDFGKISGLAKGARRPKGPFESALDLLALCRIVFIHKSSDVLDLLTEAKLQRRFRSASRDLSRLYAGYYIAELLREMIDEGDPHPDLFDATEETLRLLDGEGSVAESLLRFEVTALRVLGHLPLLDACVECGQPVASRYRVPFGLLAGGVLCEEHCVGKKRVVRISRAAVEALQCFADPSDAWKEYHLEPRLRGELRGVLNYYISHLLGRRPRMHKYLGMFVG